MIGMMTAMMMTASVASGIIFLWRAEGMSSFSLTEVEETEE